MHWPKIAIVLLLMGVAHVTVPLLPQAQADWPRMFGSDDQPGTPGWWKSNKKKAIHEPGRGYKVPGVEGYFDGKGRPIDAPVSDIARDPSEIEPKGIAPWLDPKPQIAKAKAAVGLGPNQQIAEQALAQAEATIAEKKYDEAADLCLEAGQRAPGTAIEQRAMFLLGECYFFGDKYAKAVEAYNELLEEHPNTPNFDETIERLWAIGQYWDNYHRNDPSWAVEPNAFDKTRPWFDVAGNAIKAYESIRMNDPTGPRADDSVMATAAIYFRRGQFEDADYHYTLLRQEYPRSEYQFEAHLLGLQSKLRKYQGPEYDGVPLQEAQKLAKQVRVQFGTRLSTEERQRLETTTAEIARMIAERDMLMAQYYDGTGHNLAAKAYYADVVNEHPQTALAGEARSRLGEIAGEPDAPDEPLDWLVEMFPENAERARVGRIPELTETNSETQVADERGGAAPVAPPETTTR